MIVAELVSDHVSIGGAIFNFPSRNAPERYRRIAARTTLTRSKVTNPKSIVVEIILNKIICARAENSDDQPEYAPAETVRYKRKPSARCRNDPKTQGNNCDEARYCEAVEGNIRRPSTLVGCIIDHHKWPKLALTSFGSASSRSFAAKSRLTPLSLKGTGPAAELRAGRARTCILSYNFHHIQRVALGMLKSPSLGLRSRDRQAILQAANLLRRRRWRNCAKRGWNGYASSMRASA